MRSRWPIVLLSVYVAAASGCGAMQTIGAPNERLYGGVRNDMGALWRNAKALSGSEDSARQPPEPVLATVGKEAALIADVPLSAAVDTLLLPLTIPAVLSGRKADADEPPATASRTLPANTGAVPHS